MASKGEWREASEKSTGETNAVGEVYDQVVDLDLADFEFTVEPAGSRLAWGVHRQGAGGGCAPLCEGLLLDLNPLLLKRGHCGQRAWKLRARCVSKKGVGGRNVGEVSIGCCAAAAAWWVAERGHNKWGCGGCRVARGRGGPLDTAVTLPLAGSTHCHCPNPVDHKYPWLLRLDVQCRCREDTHESVDRKRGRASPLRLPFVPARARVCVSVCLTATRGRINLRLPRSSCSCDLCFSMHVEYAETIPSCPDSEPAIVTIHVRSQFLLVSKKQSQRVLDLLVLTDHGHSPQGPYRESWPWPCITPRRIHTSTARTLLTTHQYRRMNACVSMHRRPFHVCPMPPRFNLALSSVVARVGLGPLLDAELTWTSPAGPVFDQPERHTENPDVEHAVLC